MKVCGKSVFPKRAARMYAFVLALAVAAPQTSAQVPYGSASNRIIRAEEKSVTQQGPAPTSLIAIGSKAAGANYIVVGGAAKANRGVWGVYEVFGISCGTTLCLGGLVIAYVVLSRDDGKGGKGKGKGKGKGEGEPQEEEVQEEAPPAPPEPGPLDLSVTVVSASDLRVADTSLIGQGSSDPFCEVVVLDAKGSLVGKNADGKDRKFKTPVVKKNLNPEWDHDLFHVVDFSEDQTLNFTVYDDDMAGAKADLLGKATLQYSDVFPNGFEGQLKLQEVGEPLNSKVKVKVQILAVKEKGAVPAAA